MASVWSFVVQSYQRGRLMAMADYQKKWAELRQRANWMEIWSLMSRGGVVSVGSLGPTGVEIIP